MVHQRIGDYEAFQEYLHAVFERVEEWLAELDPAELTRVVIGRPFPEQIASTYSARVAGPEGSRSSMRRSAGSTSTDCATWARSSWPGAWSASAG